NMWNSVSQQIANLDPKATYSVRLWIKAQDVRDAAIYLNPNWPLWKCPIPTGTYGWKYHRCLDFGPGGNLDVAEFRVLMERPGRLWVDDVMMYELTAHRRTLCALPWWLGSGYLCP